MNARQHLTWCSRDVEHADLPSSRSLRADESEPHGQHARPARFLPREPRGAGSLLVARIAGTSADGSHGGRHPRSGQRPGALPETLGNAGFDFTIPPQFTPQITKHLAIVCLL